MLVSIDNIPLNLKRRPYIVLGNFDGIHLGHRELIKKACSLAKENDGISMIYTFKEHPLRLIDSKNCPGILMDNKRRIEIFESLGADVVKFYNFDETVMKMSPNYFIKKLVLEYKPLGIIVGFNFRFGYKNLGDVNLIEEFSHKYNFKLYVINAVKMENTIVSSTFIRSFIKEGNMNLANKFLDSYFSIYGKVNHGKEIGRILDFPTINQDLSFYIMPAEGVYYTNVLYKSKLYRGITNIGYNPTVCDDCQIKIETHILDFNQDIYGEYIRVFFIERTRPEIKFNSLEDLKIQLISDKEEARNREFINL